MMQKLATLIYAGLAGLLLVLPGVTPSANAQTQLQVYGLWHCGSDACTWGAAPNMATFDTQNHWVIDRGNGSPSVNLVVLSFVSPLKLMNLTTDSITTNGIPKGMTSTVVNYFESKGVRVMMSIGGISYTKDWTKALGTNPMQLGINAANAAKQFNVGMEIDYEKSSNPDLVDLQKFVTAYRSVLPYDATGANQAARLTIDLGDGDTYLTALANYASTNWLKTTSPVLDYANAMVSSQKTSISTSESLWQQHIDGLSGSVPPLAPAKLAGSVWVVGNNVIPNCNSYGSSDQEVAANFVETIPAAGAGKTPGMLGYMFWGGGCQGNGTVCTFPPDSCEGGVGAGATALNIPIPMPALRQN